MTKKREISESASMPLPDDCSYQEILSEIALPVMFKWPHYIEQSGWLEHIPFAFWLMEAHRPTVVVELGAHYGVSFFAFCQAADSLRLACRLHAIDTWKGDPHAGFYGELVFEKVQRHAQLHYPELSRLHRMTFDEAVAHFAPQSIDLLHIDGLHTYDAVRHDFDTWLPKLSQRGIVLIHDTNYREKGFEVFRFFEEIKHLYPYFEFSHCNGLGVAGVGTEYPTIIKRLFNYQDNPAAHRIVNRIFARLGHSSSMTRAANVARHHIRKLEQRISKQLADDSKYN